MSRKWPNVWPECLLVDTYWALFDFSSSSSVDARLRRDGVELFNTLWGRLTPSCVPPQGVSKGRL